MSSNTITRNDLKNILDRTLPSSFKYSDTLIFSQTYTTGTANTWTKSIASVTIPKSGLYRIRAGYSNSAVLGVAWSATSAGSIVQAVIGQENATGASVEIIEWLPAGNFAIWTKNVAASKTNSIMIWQIDVVQEHDAT